MATNPALTRQASRRRDDPVITGLVTRARNGERQAWDAPAERYAPLIWSICRRHRLEAADAPGRRPERLAQARGPARQPARPGRAARLAGHHHPARMRPHPAHRAAALRRRVCAGRRDHPRRSGPGGRAGPARGRTARGPARGVRAAAPRLPAAARPAHPRSCAAVRRDQHPDGHPGRQHRAHPPPLPGQATLPPGRHRAGQCRHLDRHVTCMTAANGKAHLCSATHSWQTPRSRAVALPSPPGRAEFPLLAADDLRCDRV